MSSHKQNLNLSTYGAPISISTLMPTKQCSQLKYLPITIQSLAIYFTVTHYIAFIVIYCKKIFLKN